MHLRSAPLISLASRLARHIKAGGTCKRFSMQRWSKWYIGCIVHAIRVSCIVRCLLILQLHVSKCVHSSNIWSRAPFCKVYTIHLYMNLCMTLQRSEEILLFRHTLSVRQRLQFINHSRDCRHWIIRSKPWHFRNCSSIDSINLHRHNYILVNNFIIINHISNSFYN